MSHLFKKPKNIKCEEDDQYHVNKYNDQSCLYQNFYLFTRIQQQKIHEIKRITLAKKIIQQQFLILFQNQ